MKTRDSVVAAVSTAIQNGAIISIDFLESSPTYPRWEMVEWYTNPNTILSYYQPLCLTVIPKRLAKTFWKNIWLQPAPFWGRFLGRSIYELHRKHLSMTLRVTFISFVVAMLSSILSR